MTRVRPPPCRGLPPASKLPPSPTPSRREPGAHQIITAATFTPILCEFIPSQAFHSNVSSSLCPRVGEGGAAESGIRTLQIEALPRPCLRALSTQLVVPLRGSPPPFAA
eukprot:TRINITY_DN28382_c0_g1_i1.p4 TRINITY_DN28382_c0_g1~~TRINITY_DN28382_c0_g1_i1.p4  ORF type:complete len:109 (+),score=1.92 TRINITY_DN28382_c0_g1_i1:298-624(+)